MNNPISTAATAAAPKVEKQVTVEILKDGHEHKGELCKVGARITVREGLGEWFKETGIGKVVSA